MTKELRIKVLTMLHVADGIISDAQLETFDETDEGIYDAFYPIFDGLKRLKNKLKEAK